MNLKPAPVARMAFALLIYSVMTGCLGWGDMFAAKHPIAADYYLMQGEGGSPSEIYLFVGDGSGSIAGPLHEIGWSKDFIILTDSNWPVPWTVIDVKQHKTIRITEAQRVNSKELSAIAILSADSAWKKHVTT